MSGFLHLLADLFSSRYGQADRGERFGACTLSCKNGLDSRVEYEFGDRVQLVQRPEWGIGSITRVENVPVNGEPARRLTIRFPNAGLKTLNAEVAHLEKIDAREVLEERPVDRISSIDRIAEDEMMAGLADRKLKEVMLAIPESCRDPFRTIEARIKSTLELYRFDQGGKGLMDWSVIQTGLDDPLSRFNRHELEQHYSRWSCERDAHLNKLLQEAREARLDVESLFSTASGGAKTVLRRRGR